MKITNLCDFLALKYFPLLPGRKEPATRHGFHATEQEISEVMQNKLDYNFAIICGRINGNLVVLDFEREEDAYAFFGSKEKFLASTFCVRTCHGGLHVYLRTLDECPKRQTKLCAHDHSFDVCGEGGYVVAPGSVICHTLCPDKKGNDRCHHTDTASPYEIASSTTEIMVVRDLQKSIENKIVELRWNKGNGSLSPPQAPGTFQELFESALKVDEELRDLYEGQWHKLKRKSRSEAEFGLIMKLVQLGFPDEDIRRIMDCCKIGKWNEHGEKGEQYRKLTIDKARRYVAERAVKRESTKFEAKFPKPVFKQDAKW